MKYQAALESCALASRATDPLARQRLLAECTRLKKEVSSEKTQVDLQTNTTNEEAKKNEKEEKVLEELTKEKNEQSDSEEEQATEKKKNELEEQTQENKKEILEEKIDLEKKRIEISELKIKTHKQVTNALKNKREEIKILIKKEKERLEKLDKKEEEVVDDGKDDEQIDVITKIIRQNKHKKKRAEVIITNITSKIKHVKEQIKTYKKKKVTVTETVTTLKEKIDHKNGKVLTLTKVLKEKQELHEKEPAVTKHVEEFRATEHKIKVIEQEVKVITFEYITVVTEVEKITKVIEFYKEEIIEYKSEIHEQEEDITDAVLIVEEQTEKAKIQEKIKEVINTQNVAFEFHQKVVACEEKLSETIDDKGKKNTQLVNAKLTLDTTIEVEKKARVTAQEQEA